METIKENSNEQTPSTTVKTLLRKAVMTFKPKRESAQKLKDEETSDEFKSDSSFNSELDFVPLRQCELLPLRSASI